MPSWVTTTRRLRRYNRFVRSSSSARLGLLVQFGGFQGPEHPRRLRQPGVRELDHRRLQRRVLSDHAPQRVQPRRAHPRVGRVLTAPMQNLLRVVVHERPVPQMQPVPLRLQQRRATNLDHVRRQPEQRNLVARSRKQQRVRVVEQEVVLEQRPDERVRRGRLARIPQRQGSRMVRLRLALGLVDLLVQPEVELPDVAGQDVNDGPDRRAVQVDPRVVR